LNFEFDEWWAIARHEEW